MEEFSGRNLAGSSNQDDSGGNASGVNPTPDAFGLAAYTESPTQTTARETATQTAKRKTSTQTVNRAKSVRTIDQNESPQTGQQVEQRWQIRLGEPPVGRPVVHDNLIIATGRSGCVYAIDVHDGVKHWQSSAEDIATTRPAIDRDLAFIGNDAGQLQAIDVADGSVRWTHEIDGNIEAAPVVQDGLVYATSDRGVVYQIDPKRGDRRAAFGHGSHAVCSLAVDRETVFLGSAGGGLQARCTTDGRERWRCVPDQAVVAAPALSDERAYAATLDSDSVLAIDRVTGTVGERFDVDSAVWGRPIVHDDSLLVATQDGVLSAYDQESGTCRWRAKLAGSTWCSPAFGDGRAFVVDDLGWAYAFDVSDGEQLWRFETDTAMTTAPTLADGVFVVATDAGTVYALAETGF